MFARFTDDARRVVVLAQEEARLLGTHFIGTEHLLLGVLRVDDAIAAGALRSLHVSADQVRHGIEAIVGPPGAAPTGHIPFTPDAKKTLERSLREARHLDQATIGPEHILLGVTRERGGVAARVFSESGVDPEQVRAAVLAVLEG